MTRIAIVAAMHHELSALLAAMPDERPVLRARREFWCGHLEGHDAVVVLARVGEVAAATPATLLVSEFDADRVVFTGTAGGLHPSARVGDVVVADVLLQHGMDASPIFPRHEVPLCGVDRFGTDTTPSSALGAAARAELDLAASGASASAESADLRRRLPEALAVEMEGAALAGVCHDLEVPFAVVRTISDRADDSAHVDFARFVEQVASRYSQAIVRRWLRDRAPDPVPARSR